MFTVQGVLRGNKNNQNIVDILGMVAGSKQTNKELKILSGKKP